MPLSDRTRRPGRVTSAFAAGAVLAFGSFFALSGGAPRAGAQTDTGSSSSSQSGPTLSFQAIDSAVTLQAVVNVPHFPAADTPVDSGGPTAQSSLDSYGTSSSYAAFPDPGQFVGTVPGLLAGEASANSGYTLPFALPPYPFSVSTQYPVNSDQQAGAGPYEIDGHNTANSAAADAIGGFQNTPAGNIALLSSHSKITDDPTNGVTAIATTDAQALTIGPLSIGEISSMSELSETPDGTLTPTTNLTISGVSVGGVAVALAPDALNVAGNAEPLPINATLQSVLSSSGITVTVLPKPSTAAGTVASQAIQITVSNINIPNTGPGTITYTIGSASVTMNSATIPSFGSILSTDTGTGLSGGSSGGTSDSGSSSSLLGSVSAASQPDSGASLAQPLPGASSTYSGNPQSLQSRQEAIVSSAQLRFDVRSAYLLLGGACAVMAIFSFVLRRLGVRTPWKASFDG